MIFKVTRCSIIYGVTVLQVHVRYLQCYITGSLEILNDIATIAMTEKVNYNEKSQESVSVMIMMIAAVNLKLIEKT